MATETESMTSAWSQFLGPSSTDRLQARGGPLEWAETTTSAAPADTLENGYLLKQGDAIEFTTAANQWIWTRTAQLADDATIVKG